MTYNWLVREDDDVPRPEPRTMRYEWRYLLPNRLGWCKYY